MFKIAALTGALALDMASAGYAPTPSPAGQGSAEQSNSSIGAKSGSGSPARPAGATGMSKKEMNRKGGQFRPPSGSDHRHSGRQGVSIGDTKAVTESPVPRFRFQSLPAV